MKGCDNNEKNEEEQTLRRSMEECSDKIRLKCNFIYLHGVDINNIGDLVKLIQQFLELRGKWKSIPYNKD